MKIPLLTLFAVLIFMIPSKSQQGDVYGVLSYNSTNCRIQVEYWIHNPTQGNNSFEIAISKVNLQWDTTLFKFIGFSSYTEGLNKYPDHWRGDPATPEAKDTNIFSSRNLVNYRISEIDTVVTTTYDTTYNMDVDTFYISPITNNDTLYYDTTYTINTITAINNTRYDTIYTYNQSLFRTLLVQRSTDSCNNLFKVSGGQSKPVMSAVLEFRNCDSANNYSFTDPNAANFIGDFANTTDTLDYRKKILFVIGQDSRPYDPSGSKCDPGTKIKSMNNIPLGADSSEFVNTQSPLAVNFLNFQVYKQNNRAILKWETSNEFNTRGFEVQRKSKDIFETIGFIPPNINSSGRSSFVFTDNDLLKNGITYYRVRQFFHTGREVLSEVKAVVNNIKPLTVLIYPNPSKGNVNIVLPVTNGTIDINMVDFSGRIIKTWNGSRLPNIHLTGLPKGIYSLVVTNRETGEKTVEKITVQ